MKLTKTLTAIAVALAATTSAAKALDELVVAYFLEWPTPNQFAQTNKLYSEALGIPVKWVSFDTGTAMSAAMASGDVHISYSQGVTPFLVATAAGQDLQIVDIAMTYSDNDNCVVRSALEITKNNAKELIGKQVGVPIGTAAHFGFLQQMAHFGINPEDMRIVDMSPVDGAAAFATGELDMVCGWGGHLRRMKEFGEPLLSGAEKEEVVGRLYDVTSIPTAFGEEYPEILAKFLKVTADMNIKYKSEGASMMGDIAKAAGQDVPNAQAVIDIFRFPTVADQLSDNWFAGWLAKDLKSVADKLEAGGDLKALGDYAPLVNPSYLEAASKM